MEPTPFNDARHGLEALVACGCPPNLALEIAR
jgi:hypothetical protein